MIAEVYLFANGMVMTFDERGEQIPEYQGKLADVQAKVLADAPAFAMFRVAVWPRTSGHFPGGELRVPREQWACFRYDHAQLETTVQEGGG